MSVKKYPRFKVMMAFLCCPFFVGLAAGPIILVSMFVELVGKPHLFGEARGGERFMVLVMAPLMAEFIFFIPFLILGSCLALSRVERSQGSVWKVSLGGGFLAVAWLQVVVFIINDFGRKSLFSDREVFLFGAFIMAMLGSGVAAYFFLPDKRQEVI